MNVWIPFCVKSRRYGPVLLFGINLREKWSGAGALIPGMINHHSVHHADHTILRCDIAFVVRDDDHG